MVRLLTRGTIGPRFPFIRAGMAALQVRSCLIDGEAVCCEVDGVRSFDLLRDCRHDDAAFLYAFDLLDAEGFDWDHRCPAPTSPSPSTRSDIGPARLLYQV
jgi:ATP-dependent DNA ligase